VFPRLPEFGELFGDTGDVVGNTRLEEERGTNFDTGAHYSSGGGVFDLDAAVFHRFARDLIQTRNYGDYLISENIGKAAITGVETWAAVNLPDKRLTGRITLTYQNAKNRSDETAFRKQRYYGKFLPYHPEWKGGVRLGLPLWKDIRATWKTDWESECFKGPSNLPDEKLDAKTIHSLDIRFSLPGRVGITVEAENLTDVHTQDRWGYPKPGRGYYLTLSWDWEQTGD
jgi:iron complex outermembrane receptor protein